MLSQTNLNVWERKTGIATSPNTNSTVKYLVADSDLAEGTARRCYADGVLVVDLTTTFGSVNEPSKEWCDKNIDYFDGTTTVTRIY